jgi:hypothetical protein
MKLLEPARGRAMTRSDWARFAAAYAVGTVTMALWGLLFNGLVDGFRKPYRGIPTLALVCASFYPLTIALGDTSARPRPTLYVVKVMVALAILGVIPLGLVEAFTRWDAGSRVAAWSLAIGAVVIPLTQVAVQIDEHARARRKAAAHGITTPPPAAG